jgi:hypothetical protein
MAFSSGATILCPSLYVQVRYSRSVPGRGPADCLPLHPADFRSLIAAGFGYDHPP